MNLNIRMLCGFIFFFHFSISTHHSSPQIISQIEGPVNVGNVGSRPANDFRRFYHDPSWPIMTQHYFLQIISQIEGQIIKKSWILMIRCQLRTFYEFHTSFFPSNYISNRRSCECGKCGITTSKRFSKILSWPIMTHHDPALFPSNHISNRRSNNQKILQND